MPPLGSGRPSVPPVPSPPPFSTSTGCRHTARAHGAPGRRRGLARPERTAAPRGRPAAAARARAPPVAAAARAAGTTAPARLHACTPARLHACMPAPHPRCSCSEGAAAGVELVSVVQLHHTRTPSLQLHRRTCTLRTPARSARLRLHFLATAALPPKLHARTVTTAIRRATGWAARVSRRSCRRCAMSRPRLAKARPARQAADWPRLAEAPGSLSHGTAMPWR